MQQLLHPLRNSHVRLEQRNNNQGGGSYIPPVNFTNHGGGAIPTGPAITYLAPKLNPTQGIIGLIIVGLIASFVITLKTHKRKPKKPVINRPSTKRPKWTKRRKSYWKK